jgi:3-deoxy-D-manno-octulosonic-acid transferase
MIRFFKWAKPEILIIIETELWPNLFHTCGRFDVPLVLASACVSDQSIKLDKSFGIISRSGLHGIVVGAQLKRIAKKFLLMGSDEARTVCYWEY